MNKLKSYIQTFPSFDAGEQPIQFADSIEWYYSLRIPFRLYQFTILQTTFYYNTLVCLPTGLGKTFIASMLILNYSKWFPKGKIFFLAPTRPLVIQQQESMFKFGIDAKLAKLDREYQDQIYFSTPQTFDNDLNKDLIKDVVLVVFDEAHKAVGDYAYTLIVNKLPQYTRIVGLSATPGNNLEQIQSVITNLRIAKIELRDEYDPEVKPYLKFKQIDKEIVSFDNCHYVSDLNDQMQPLLNAILSFNILPVELIRVCSRATNFSFGACFKLKEFLCKGDLYFTVGSSNASKIHEHLQHLNKLAYAKKILLEQGIVPYAQYMGLHDIQEQHPKVFKLKQILSDHVKINNSKVIIFTNSRENAQNLCDHIKDIQNVNPSIFIGQASTKNKAGMKQREQLAVLEQFKTNINVLVATCIAEEGLDIGEVDLIICYDSGFSPIRMIQRMGRTGRKRDGKIIVLLTEGKELADYEKSVNKYQKLIKELKNSNLNYYSCNPRVLQQYPELQIIDGNINDIEIKRVDEPLTKIKSKISKRRSKQQQKSNNVQISQIKRIKPLESYFCKIIPEKQQLDPTINNNELCQNTIQNLNNNTNTNTNTNNINSIYNIDINVKIINNVDNLDTRQLSQIDNHDNLDTMQLSEIDLNSLIDLSINIDDIEDLLRSETKFMH